MPRVLPHGHAHPLVVLTPEPNLGRGMQRLVGGYAFSFNRRHERRGHLFAGPYYAKLIDGESHLVKACVYVVLNPVTAGLCTHPRQWRWSSYVATVAPQTDGVAQPDRLLALLDEDARVARMQYRELVDEAVRDLLDDVQRPAPD